MHVLLMMPAATVAAASFTVATNAIVHDYQLCTSLAIRTLCIHSGGTPRPRSSVWNMSADVARPLWQNGEEQAAVYKTSRTALTAPAMSPRLPWLQPAALTADKFRQPRRHQSARLAEHAGIVTQVCKSDMQGVRIVGWKFVTAFV